MVRPTRSHPRATTTETNAKAKVVLVIISSVLGYVCFQNVLESFLHQSRFHESNLLLESVESMLPTVDRQRSLIVPPQEQFDTDDQQTTNAPNDCVIIPILPLTSSVKHSHRPIFHLTMDRKQLTPVGLPAVPLYYLNQSFAALKAEHLYPIQNYQKWYESAVTHLWIAILQQLQGQEATHMVIDGGMNTGFYTTLTAVMGFDVHSFELQLDCFDVARLLLRGNKVDANLYHIGISDHIKVIDAGEGCDPGYAVTSKARQLPKGKLVKWEHRTHRVMLLPLDVFLDQKRNDRRIALIKLDLEGHEVLALRGLQRHLHAVQNIVMEVSPVISKKMGVTFQHMQEEFQKLEMAGFQPYLLWLPQIVQKGWFNATYLAQSGVKNAREHPILGPDFTIGTDSSCMLWEIESYERLFNNTCVEGCNVLFSRRRSQQTIDDPTSAE